MLSTSTTRQLRVAIMLAAIVSFGAPVTVTAQGPAASEAKPFEAYSNSARTLRDSIVIMARAQIGTRYRHGGTTPTRGFDCSGLIKYVMSALNLDLPRTARQQAAIGLPVNKDTSRLLPGDLLTFARTKKGTVSHIGIYIGDGKYIHASSVAGKVIESKIDRPVSPLIKMWKGARRVLSLDDSVSATTVATGKSGGN